MAKTPALIGLRDKLRIAHEAATAPGANVADQASRFANDVARDLRQPHWSPPTEGLSREGEIIRDALRGIHLHGGHTFTILKSAVDSAEAA